MVWRYRRKIFLNSLRCIFIANLWVFFSVLRHGYFNFASVELEAASDDYANDLPWSKVNLRIPPKAKTALQESIRLNEGLAHSQYDCKNVLPMPPDSHLPVPVCVQQDGAAEREPLGIDPSIDTALLIASYASDLRFEKYLVERSPSAQITLYAPTDRIFRHGQWSNFHSYQQLSVKLKGSDEVFSQIEAELFSRPSWSLVSLACMQCNDPTVFQTFMRDIIRKGLTHRMRQLHLTVRIPAMNHDLLHDWYIILQSLFYDGHMALYRANQVGECGRRVQNCQYKLSFVGVPPNGHHSVLPPIMGLSTPDEEFNRVYHHIVNGPKNCPTKSSVSILGENWTLCSPIQTPCTILVNRISSKSMTVSESGEHQCKINVFDPTLKHSQEMGHFSYHNFSLTTKSKGFNAPGLDESNNLWWTFKPFESLTVFEKPTDRKADRRKPTDLMIFDLQGGEDDLFEDALVKDLFSDRFKQIIVRMRLYYGEEFDVERRRFSWWLRLEQQGIRIGFVQIIDGHRPRHFQTLVLTLVNDKFLDGNIVLK